MSEKSLIEWLPHRNRILLIRLATKAINLTYIQYYALTDTADRKIKEELNCRLDAEMTSIHKGDIKF